MGLLTTITIHNDAMGEFEKDPKAFGEAILKGIYGAQYERKEVSVPIGSYSNYIKVQPSRHADDDTIYLHSGNSVSQLNVYSQDFKKLVSNHPDLVKRWLAIAQYHITKCGEYLKHNS